MSVNRSQFREGVDTMVRKTTKRGDKECENMAKEKTDYAKVIYRMWCFLEFFLIWLFLLLLRRSFFHVSNPRENAASLIYYLKRNNSFFVSITQLANSVIADSQTCATSQQHTIKSIVQERT